MVRGHPVDHEAHRTFLRWLGCAVGAAKHEAADAALAAVNELQPAPQATVAGRSSIGICAPYFCGAPAG